MKRAFRRQYVLWYFKTSTFCTFGKIKSQIVNSKANENVWYIGFFRNFGRYRNNSKSSQKLHSQWIFSVYGANHKTWRSAELVLVANAILQNFTCALSTRRKTATRSSFASFMQSTSKIYSHWLSRRTLPNTEKFIVNEITQMYFAIWNILKSIEFPLPIMIAKYQQNSI